MRNSQKDFHKKLLGKRGERLVYKDLIKRGYKSIKRNFRTPFGEADIVVFDENKIKLVEVKTRTSNLFGEPKDAVDSRKIEKYHNIARFLISKYGEIQIENTVAEVYYKDNRFTVNYIEEAF